MFLTDFGVDNIYTSMIESVIWRINPNTKIIKLNNSIEPYNVRQASFLLMATHTNFSLRVHFFYQLLIAELELIEKFSVSMLLISYSSHLIRVIEFYYRKR